MSQLLDIRNLNVSFPGHDAVKNLSFGIEAGETLALVGESGCGKSTTALSLLRLLPDSARVSGSIVFEGRDLQTLPEEEICALRGNAISMIFQEPMTSLNPVLTVGQQVVEAIRLHQPLSAQAAKARAIELLELVRIPEPQRRFNDYPHNLSGGQRQRVMIAMAVSCHPRLLVADEPTTALDVTIQAQILELLDQLRRELSMAVLLITHDLAVVEQWADRLVVMYGGKKSKKRAARSCSSGRVIRIRKACSVPPCRWSRTITIATDDSLRFVRNRRATSASSRCPGASMRRLCRRFPSLKNLCCRYRMSIHTIAPAMASSMR